MTIREMIQELAKTGDELYSKLCKVDRVDEKRRIFDATPVDGSAPVLEVRLQPVENRTSGLIFVPKVGSFVIVTFFSPEDTYFAMGTEYSKVLLQVGDAFLEIIRPDDEDEKRAFITLRNGDEQTGPCIEVDENTILMRNGDREDEGCPTFRLEKERVTVHNGETSIEMLKDPSSGNDRILLKNGNNPHSPKMEMTNEKISFFEGERGMVDVVKLQEIVKKIVDWCNTHKHTVSVDTKTGLGDTKTLTSTIDSLQISDFEHDTMRYSAKKKN